MEWLYATAGTLLVVAAIVDAVAHTIALRGGGPAAKRLGSLLWRFILLSQNRPWFPRLAAAAGPIILLCTFLLWSLMLWGGWALIFSSDHSAIVNSTDGTAAGAWDRLYYAGFVLTTLGIGDYVPRGSLFQALSVIAAGMGFFLITLFVTYVLSVVSAVTFKRALAFDILSLARTPEQLVIRSWQDGRFRSLEQYFLNVSRDLVTLSQQHLAYPALHFFRSVDTTGSPGVAVAVLDEALTLIEHGVAPEHRPNPLLLRAVRDSIRQLADTVTSSDHHGLDAPPLPNFAALQAAGIPTISEDEFRQQLQGLAERRSMLNALLHYDGRSWASTRNNDNHPDRL